MKLASLKPRVQAAILSHVSPAATLIQRMRGRALQERRRRWFAEHPLCVKCQEANRVRAATELDHTIPLHLGGRDDKTNLQGLCHDCHEAKSKREASARGA